MFLVADQTGSAAIQQQSDDRLVQSSVIFSLK